MPPFLQLQTFLASTHKFKRHHFATHSFAFALLHTLWSVRSNAVWISVSSSFVSPSDWSIGEAPAANHSASSVTHTPYTLVEGALLCGGIQSPSLLLLFVVHLFLQPRILPSLTAATFAFLLCSSGVASRLLLRSRFGSML